MTTFTIKTIASAAMLLDHVFAVFPSSFPRYFNYIGRFAFPVYAFMTAQGCKHTKNINRYLLRLGIFALISEVFFDAAFMSGVSFVDNTNVFYTLFFGVACVAIYEKLKIKLTASGSERELTNKPFRRIIPVLPMIPIVSAGRILNTDYGMSGIIIILIFYFAKPETGITRAAAAAGFVICKYGYLCIFALFRERGIYLPYLGQRIPFSAPGAGLYCFLFALISVPVIFLYNGKQGPKLKWSFYAFYPVHIAVLTAIKYFAA